MRIKSFIVVSALLIAVQAFGDEPAAVAGAQATGAVAPAEAQAEDEPETIIAPAEEERPAAPSNEELAGKIDSITEAFTEMRNSVDLLSKLKVSGYIQAQYVEDESSRDELNGSSTRNRDQFSIRRGRVKFTYQHSPTSKFVLQPDVTSSGVSLKDGYLELTEPWTTWKHTLTAGQFNWPFGFEIAYSSSSREVPERSRVYRTLFNGERDRGVMLSGAGFNERFNYRVAIVNGTGTSSSSDLNQQKDVVGRIGYSLGALDLGASMYRGKDLVATSTDPKGRNFDKERTGIDFQWATPIQGLGIRGEYLVGTQAPSSGTTRTESHDVSGWYLYLIQNLGTKHQFVVRADQYDPDTDVDDNAIRTINPSYIFHWDANSKVMASYELIESQANDPDDNIFTLRYQYSF